MRDSQHNTWWRMACMTQISELNMLLHGISPPDLSYQRVPVRQLNCVTLFKKFGTLQKWQPESKTGPSDECENDLGVSHDGLSGQTWHHILSFPYFFE